MRIAVPATEPMFKDQPMSGLLATAFGNLAPVRFVC